MFSLQPQELDEIEIKIKHALEKIPIEANAGIRWSDSAWTRKIKNVVSEIGHEDLRLSVCANRCGNSDDPEWLYDLCGSIRKQTKTPTMISSLIPCWRWR